MQSIPGYYPQSFPPPSPYPASGSPTTSSVMSSSPAPIIATNLPPMQSQVHSMSATPATDSNKRKQVKNACNEKTVGVKAENGANSNAIANGANSVNGSNANSNDHNGNNNNGNEGNFSGALRGAPTAIPFGYPSNLNQYGQPYDPYGTYATYGKDQILPQSYVMSYPQHLTGILTQRADSQQQFGQQTAYYQKTDSSPTMSSSEQATAANATSTTTTTSPATENVAPTATPEEQIITAVAAAVKAPMTKEENASEKEHTQVKKEGSRSDNGVAKGEKSNGGEKPQPITPMPSTSNSSGTSSPSDTHEEDQSSKFSGLTQLCSAALNQNKNSTSQDTNRS
ncbi:hypothetical protein K501DRAFT_47599 [Backusella circina FSU 941]|nr:hypothetical protein K501DRAFT_47599 [Backusella circina FSU 941]